jgi:hypothetical protein
MQMNPPTKLARQALTRVSTSMQDLAVLLSPHHLPNEIHYAIQPDSPQIQVLPILNLFLCLHWSYALKERDLHVQRWYYSCVAWMSVVLLQSMSWKLMKHEKIMERGTLEGVTGCEFIHPHKFCFKPPPRPNLWHQETRDVMVQLRFHMAAVWLAVAALA